MNKDRINSREAGIAWAVRRGVYLAGAAIGVALVASGRVTQEQVDGWLPLVVELGGVLTTLGFAFAAWRTGPDSDNSRPVVDARELESLFDLLERIVGQVSGRPGVAPPESAVDGPETGEEPEPGHGPGSGVSSPENALLDDLYYRIHGTPRPR